MRSVRRSVEAGPIPTLEAASALVATTSRSARDHGDDGTSLDLAELLGSFLDAPFPVMRVLATAMLPMLDDELLAHRIRHQLERSRIPAAPDWLDDLGEPEPAGTLRIPDPLGDGENILVSVAWRGRRAGTVMIYIDHNMGTIVKDAFVVPEGLDGARALWAGVAGDEAVLEEIDPADAKARITEAIRACDLRDPPYETETWPAVRPLVEWWTSLLPDGGRGFERRAVPAHEIEAVAGQFARSPEARPLGLPLDQVMGLSVPLLWFASQSEPGDPLRWSPVSVEVALVDWVPTHVLLPADELPPLLDVLKALVRFAHRERGVAGENTDETLAAVDRWAPSMLGSAARLDLRELPDHLWDDLDDEDLDDDELDDDEDGPGAIPLLPSGEIDILTIIDQLERRLITSMGGAESAAALDRRPLPRHRIDRSIVPDDLVELVDDVVHRIDEVCTAELDDELTSICHHYVGALLDADPVVFRRSQRADLIAAGLVWAAVTLQHHVAGRPADPTVPTQKRLAAAMGVTAGSMSGRSGSIRRALERHTDLTRSGPWHSAKRCRWLDELDELELTRQRFLERLDDDPLT